MLKKTRSEGPIGAGCHRDSPLTWLKQIFWKSGHFKGKPWEMARLPGRLRQTRQTFNSTTGIFFAQCEGEACGPWYVLENLLLTY